MRFEVVIFLILAVVFIMTCWIGWYTILVIVALGILLSIYLYMNKKTKNKSAKKSDDLYFGIIASSLIGGTIVVAICMMLKGCLMISGPSYDTIERRTKIHTSDGDIMPTMYESGEYHNAGTGERQIEYGGSIEQKRDIEAADRLIENGY